MHPPDKQKIDKLTGCIHALLNDFFRHEHSVAVQRTIDPYYYVQKIEELKHIYVAVTLNRLPYHTLTEHYRLVYCQWRKDSRWLNEYVRDNR
jgi:hypothetical protein